MTVNTIQFAWRIRTDSTAAEGGTPVWAAAQNVTAYPGLTTPFRIRFGIENTGTVAASHPWSLMVSRNGAPPTLVTTSSSFVQAVDATAGASANNSAISTALLTGYTGTVASGVYNDTGTTSAFGQAATTYKESEFGLELTSSCAAGDTYQFFVYFNSLPLIGSVQAPTITIPGATITAPVFLCNANLAAIASGTASPPTTTDAPSGSLIYLWLITWTANDTISAVTDSAGNTYTSSLVSAPSNAAFTASSIAWISLPSDLPQGTTFTVTTGSGGNWSAQIYSVSGVDTIDKTTTQSQTTAGTSASESTGTLGAANEIIFAFIQNQSSSFGTYTEDGAFNQFFNDSSGDGAYKIVSATTSVTWAPSWTTSSEWNAVVVSFKAAITTVSLLTAASARGSGNLSLGGNASLLVTSKAKATGGASTAGVTGLLAIGKSRIAGQNQPSGIVGILSRGEAQSKGGSQPSGRVSIGIKTAAQATAKLSGSFALALKAAAKARASGRNAPSGVVGLAARAVSDAFARTAISAVTSLVSIAASSSAMAKSTSLLSARAAITAASAATSKTTSTIGGAIALGAKSVASARVRLTMSATAGLVAGSNAIATGRSGLKGIVRIAASAHASATSQSSIYALANLAALSTWSTAVATSQTLITTAFTLTGRFARMVTGSLGPNP